MKRQEAFKIIIAAFLALTMVFSIFAYFFIEPRDDNTQQKNEEKLNEDKYDPDLWALNAPFNSISDSLKITPYGVEFANYADFEGMTPQMIQQVKQDFLDIASLVDEVDAHIYKSNTTRIYYSRLKEDNNASFMLLTTISPEKNDFEFIEIPNSYPPVLRRQDQQYNGLYNILGRPAILAPPQTAANALGIIYSQNKTATAYDQYEGLLGKVDNAPFQIVNSNVSFAKQFYLGVKPSDGGYERTTAYLNVNSTTLKKLNQLKANGTQKGFRDYNITASGNYTLVKIVSSDISRLLSEEIT